MVVAGILLYVLSDEEVMKFSSIKVPSTKRPTFIWRPAAKVPEKLRAIHSNKNFYSTATSIKRLRPASCRPKGNLVLLYTSIKRPGRYEVGGF